MKIAKFVFKLQKILKPYFVESNACIMVQKRRVVVSYKNCKEEVLQAIREKYPLGYGDAIIKVQKPSGDFFHAITIDFEDISYLVKVDVKIDNFTEEEFEKQFGSTSTEGASDGDNFGVKNESEDPDSLPSTDSNYDE